MRTGEYRFRFSDSIQLGEVETTLQLAIVAVEGLYGPANVRLETVYHLDPDHHAILVDAASQVGAAVARVFTGFLLREVGEDAFEVRPVSGLAQAVEGTAA